MTYQVASEDSLSAPTTSNKTRMEWVLIELGKTLDVALGLASLYDRKKLDWKNE